MTIQKFFPYAQQSISESDIAAVGHSLKQTMITRGELVKQFEEAFAKDCGANYAVAFNSGTAALQAAYFAGNVGPGDTILSTPNTFVSTVGAAVELGASPVFVDICLNTGNLNLDQVALNLRQPKSRGKYIVAPVHFSGIPVDMQHLDKIIDNPETLVVEDAAHAVGSRYKDGSKVGCCTWSHMTIFSFHPAKTMTTGEGGLVTTNDPDLYHRLQLYRNNGIERESQYLEQSPGPWYYEVKTLSGNYNFTEMQAALGLSQLSRLESFIDKRRKLLEIYKAELGQNDNIQILQAENECFVAPHLAVALIDFESFKKSKADVMLALKEKGIGTQVHYIPVYHHPYFKDQYGDVSEYFPEMERYYSRALSLPLYYDLCEEDVVYIINTLKSILA